MNFKTKNSGFLVPVESMDGKIQACQIRLDHPRDNNKYLWFSSAGYPHGVSSGSPVHVIGDLDVENVYLTEGGLKGSIAHYLSGHTFICLAGVNMYRSLRPVLEEFQQRKMKFLFEAFDMDKKLKTDCDKHYHKCSVCSEKGYAGKLSVQGGKAPDHPERLWKSLWDLPGAVPAGQPYGLGPGCGWKLEWKTQRH